MLSEAKRFNVLMCGRRFGKTTLGIRRIIHGAARGLPVAWYSPTYKMLSEVWREVEAVAAPMTAKTDKQERRIELVNGGAIDFWSLDAANTSRGRKYAEAVIDEAALVRDLSDAWNGAIRPTLTDLKGGAWFLTTPQGRDYCYELFELGQAGDPEWMSWRMLTIDNEFIDAAEVDAARRTMPEHVFRQEYEGVPADDGGNPFGLDAIRQCIAPLGNGKPVVFGIDLAKSQDYTVIIGLDASGRVCHFDRFQRPWEQTIEAILATIGNTPTLMDSTGVGDPIYERVSRVGRKAEPFNFNQGSKQAVMRGLAAAISERSVSFPDGEIVRELERFRYVLKPGGNVAYSAPTGLHDDCVCALALAVHHRTMHKPATAFVMSVKTPPGQRSRMARF